MYRQNRSCSCHASCLEAGTCCADFMEAAAEAAEEEEPPPRGPATACEEVRVSAALVTRHVSLVATCPPGHPAPGHVAGCGRRAGAGRYTHLLDIPVTSLDTGLVYRWPLDTVRLDDVFVSFAPFLLSLYHKTYLKRLCLQEHFLRAVSRRRGAAGGPERVGGVRQLGPRPAVRPRHQAAAARRPLRAAPPPLGHPGRYCM